MDHKNFKEISDEEICQEIEGVNSILTSWGLEPTTIVRPPYGGWNNHVRDVVQYPMIRWNLDTLDWKTRGPSCTIYNVLQDPELAAVDGDIILMHDIHAETIEACRTITVSYTHLFCAQQGYQIGRALQMRERIRGEA